VKLLTYVEKRWKTMTFVKAGLLVQDKMPESTTPPKAGEPASASDEAGSKKAKKRRKREKSKDSDSQRASEESQGDGDSAKLRRDKKEKRKKKKVSKVDSTSEPDDGTDGSSVKKSKKRKEKMDATSDSEKDSDLSTAKSLKKKRRKEKTESSNTPEVLSEHTPTEFSAGLIAARERTPQGRHILRSRHIHQKKMALMDSKSLNEVCLVCRTRKDNVDEY
jgi:Pin2-interacting protein X1